MHLIVTKIWRVDEHVSFVRLTEILHDNKYKWKLWQWLTNGRFGRLCYGTVYVHRWKWLSCHEMNFISKLHHSSYRTHNSQFIVLRPYFNLNQPWKWNSCSCRTYHSSQELKDSWIWWIIHWLKFMFNTILSKAFVEYQQIKWRMVPIIDSLSTNTKNSSTFNKTPRHEKSLEFGVDMVELHHCWWQNSITE